MKPTKKTDENTTKEFPYPPKMVTRVPKKKMAAAVTILPTLKQNPVAVALIITGKSKGIYTESEPWLIPNIKDRRAISKSVTPVKLVFVLKRINAMIKQPEYEISIAFLMPTALDIHPDAKPPARPPIPRSIMLRPLSC